MKQVKKTRKPDPHIFNRIIFKDKNEPVNLVKKSDMAVNIVGGLEKNLEKVGTRELTTGQRAQLIKTKEKEEIFLSKLDNKERKKFYVKKKLFELISPFDEDEKRLEEVMAVANIKSLPSIFKFAGASKSRNLFKTLNTKRNTQQFIPLEGGKESIEVGQNSQDIRSILLNTNRNSSLIPVKEIYLKKFEFSEDSKNSSIIPVTPPMKNHNSSKSILTESIFNKNLFNTKTVFGGGKKSSIDNPNVINQMENLMSKTIVNGNSPLMINNLFRSRNSSINSPLCNKQAFTMTPYNNNISQPISNIPTQYTQYPGNSLFTMKSNQKPREESAKLKLARSQVRKLISKIAKENLNSRRSNIRSSNENSEMGSNKRQSIIASSMHNRKMSSFL
jgi:hypothetical protein